jgi:hypothetical protein
VRLEIPRPAVLVRKVPVREVALRKVTVWHVVESSFVWGAVPMMARSPV